VGAVSLVSSSRSTPRCLDIPAPADCLTNQAQLSGDAHLANFGGFASPERDLVFDPNDFDETLPGPFEWDVKRLAASFEIAARQRNFGNAARTGAVVGVVRTYRRTLPQDRSRFANHGQRVVEGQRLTQASSDIFLGWGRAEGDLDGGPRDFYVCQLWDWKSSVDVETILPHGLAAYARACGWTLARAHARSGDRIAIAA